MARKNLLLLTILVLSILSVNPTKVSAQKNALTYIDPATITDMAIGENFTISVKTNYTGDDVWGYQFSLAYNPNVLHGLSKPKQKDTWTGNNKTKIFNATQTPIIPDSEKVCVNNTLMTRVTLEGDIWTGDNVTNVFYTTKKPIVEDSEEVYVNQIIMTKDVDYTIDYTTGNITFTTAPEEGAEVKAIYLYGTRTRMRAYIIKYVKGEIEFLTAPGEGVEVKVIYLYYGVNNGDLVTSQKGRIDFSRGSFNNEEGKSTMIFAYFRKEGKTTSGPGTLATVTFQVVGTGSSNITPQAPSLPGTELGGWNPTDGYYKIPVILQHGFFLLSSIHVDPAMTYDPTLKPDKNYTVSIKTDDSGTDIWGWNFTLTYNPNVLNGTSVTNGDLVTKAKHSEAEFIAGTFNNTMGKLSLTTAYFYYSTPPPNLTSGPGTLANITFEVVGTGASNITLGPETRLIGYNATTGKKYNIIDATTMPHRIQHGSFSNVIHDINITSVVAFPNRTEVGELVSINVNVTNEGEASETYDVTVYAEKDKKITVGTQTNTTAAGNSTILTFPWNTTGLTSGNYNITANATRVLNEENISNNVGTTQVILFGPPIANFTYSPLKPLVGEIVTFISTSYDLDGTITSYEWNFGDGNITSGDYQVIIHNYTAAETYTVNLTVTDNDNETSSALNDIAVRDVPVADFDYAPDPQKVNETVQFVAQVKGNIISYEWDFGDGTSETGEYPTHTYTSIGTYNVTLTITDSEGLNDTTWKTLTVVGDPAAVFTYSPEPPLKNEKVTFNASLSKPIGGTITSYEWNFGDGNTTTVTDPVITHIYTTFGNHTVTLTITDSEYLTGTSSKNITILATPVANFTYSPTEPIVEKTITFISTSSDLDGNITNWEWDLDGDGVTDVFTENATYTYTEAGNYTVTLTVTDNDGLTNTATRLIRVEEAPEEALGIPLIVIAAAAAAIIVIAAIAVYLLKIRKPK